LGLELRVVDVRDAGEIERGITTFALVSGMASTATASTPRPLLRSGGNSLHC
jgi:hypothetical protein